MGDILSWLPAVGSSAAAIVVMIQFLAYLTKRDERQEKITEQLIQRIEERAQADQSQREQIKTDFLNALKEAWAQNREIHANLFAVARETTTTMTVMTQRIAELAASQTALGQALTDLRSEIQHPALPAPPNEPRKRIGN